MNQDLFSSSLNIIPTLLHICSEHTFHIPKKYFGASINLDVPLTKQSSAQLLGIFADQFQYATESHLYLYRHRLANQTDK